MLNYVEGLMESLWQWIAGVAVALWMALLTWTGKRQVERITDMETRKADKSQVTELRAEFHEVTNILRAQHKEASESRRRLHERLEKHISEQHRLNVQLAELIGWLEGQSKVIRSPVNPDK